MSARFNASLVACMLVLLAGCASSPEHHDQANSDILTPDTILKPVAPVEAGNADTGISLSSQALSDQEPPKPELQVGTGKFFTKVPSTKVAPSGEADVVFNFENQPVQAVIKAVLGDLLQENYTIASNVGGNVTFSTAKPIHRSEALSVLETLLAANGISLVHENNRYSVVLTKDAIPGRLAPSTLPANAARGYELRIFPLHPPRCRCGTSRGAPRTTVAPLHPSRRVRTARPDPATNGRSCARLEHGAKRLAKLLHTGAHARLHGAEGLCELRRDLALRETAEVCELDDAPLRGGQLRERSSDDRARLGELGAAIRGLDRWREHECLALVGHDCRVLEDTCAALTGANEVERARAGDGCEPGGDTAACGVEPGGGAPDLRKGVGHDLLGICWLADDGARE